MRMIAVFLFIVTNSLLVQPIKLQAASRPSVKRQNSTAPTYRGKPLSFYVTQASTAQVRTEAIRSIGSFGSQGASAIALLTDGLRDDNVEVRIASAWAISQAGSPANVGTVRALAQALSDADPKVRSLSAVALRGLGPAAVEAVPALITALSDSAHFVRAPAADALGNIGPGARSAVGPLVERLKVKDEQIFVLRSVATALGKIGPDAQSALPALNETLKMTRVTYAALEAILRITGKPIASYW
jgi:HEAT repeat protein